MDEKVNILLIVVDALRADHLSCYGYSRPTSPNVDALAAEGVLNEQFVCSAIPTQPSFTTLYTGQHAITHGIVAHGGTAELAADTPVLPELFLKAGYTTCALDSLWREKSWFGRGYEFYIDPSLRHNLPIMVTCEELNNRAIPWLQAHATEPFFLCIHYWDPHYPYAPPDHYRNLFYQGNPTDPSNHSLDAAWDHPVGAIARDTWLATPEGVITDAEYVIALYDQAIRYLDDGIGKLVATLDELGIAERTLVMTLADHGESLTEHGIFFEHFGLYNCTLHVPLIARWLGRLPAGARLPQMLQMTDIAPTVLEAAGLPIPETMEGLSFWKLLTGEEQAEGHNQIISVECSWQAKWSLYTGHYKFILAREPDFESNPLRELYDLATDPQEQHNIVEERPLIASALETELEKWIVDRLHVLGRNEDPLREQGISLKNVISGGYSSWASGRLLSD